MGECDLDLPKNLQQNLCYRNLVDMIDFEDIDSNKKIFLSEKRKVNFEEIWGTSKLIPLQKIAVIQKGKSITKAKTKQGKIPVIAGGQSPAYYHNESNREGNDIIVSASGAYAGFINYFDSPIFASDCNTIQSINENEVPTKLIFHILKSIQKDIYELQRGQAQPHVYGDDLEKIKIPIIEKGKQQVIINKINEIETKAKTIVVKNLEAEIKKIILTHIS